MNDKDLKISFRIVLYFVIGSFLLTIVGAFAKIQQWDVSQIFLIGGLILFFSTWIIILSDMLKSKIYQKSIWVMSMFIMPSVAVIVYLLRRDKLKTHK